MRTLLLRAVLLGFIFAGTTVLLEESAEAGGCCPAGYDHECAINCTDFVWAPCMEAGLPQWYCNQLGIECTCPDCCL